MKAIADTCCGPLRMRVVCVILGIAGIVPNSGCMALRNLMVFRQRDPLAGAPRLRDPGNPQMEDVVAHVNENIDRVQRWRSNHVRIITNQLVLTGTLAVEKGRHVRLVVNSPMGNEVDLGSNEERFWVWSRRMDPAFVTCRHENLEVARQQLGIPFEPDWLLQALGVAPLPTTGLKMEVDPSRHQARLIQQVITAHGLPLRRAVLVDLKQGIVLEHSLYDHEANRVALAKLSDHRWDRGVILPRRVLLDWPQSQMSMTMELGRVQINPDSIPDEIWEMPERKGYQIVNLDAGIPPRIAVRPESPVHLDEIEPSDGSDWEEDSAQQELPADESTEDFERIPLRDRDFEASGRLENSAWDR